MKVNLTDTIYYWHYRWDTTHINDIISTTREISNQVNSKHGGHGLWLGDKSKEWVLSQNFGVLDGLIIEGIRRCEEIHELPYNSINIGTWVNIIDKDYPKQNIRITNTSKLIYHSHTKIQSELGLLRPDYTFVFYIQMPNNLKGKDGKLFIKDKNNKEVGILPKEGDLIILNGDVPHAPVDAPNSTKDRIVFAGNISLQNIKNTKTLM